MTKSVLWCYRMGQTKKQTGPRSKPVNQAGISRKRMVERTPPGTEGVEGLAKAEDPSPVPIFEHFPRTVQVMHIPGGIGFQWTRPGVGFGELILLAKHGKLVVYAECMGEEFCLDVIKQAFEERGPCGS